MRNIFLASAAAATALAGLGVSAPAFAQAGSYGGSCRNTQSANGVLTAECADGQGRYHTSSIPFGQCRGDIGNNNGMLTCNGAVATGGQIVGGGDNRGGDNRGGGRRDNNNGAVAAGVVAGAILGGALAGNGGFVAPPPPPPPSYGDRRYGDPRFDWRYQEGGYGYGRRQGEWVPIRDRAEWLSRQIDQLQRSGRIDYRDARDYRRQLDQLRERERNETRYGQLGARERNDLDRRFNDLTEEVRRDARSD
jgi:hypothetical protein